MHAANPSTNWAIPPALKYPILNWMYIGGLTNAEWWELLGNFLLFPRYPDRSTLPQHKPHSQRSPWQTPELTSLPEMLGRGRLDEDEAEHPRTTYKKRRNSGISCQLTLFLKIKFMKSFTQQLWDVKEAILFFRCIKPEKLSACFLVKFSFLIQPCPIFPQLELPSFPQTGKAVKRCLFC